MHPKIRLVVLMIVTILLALADNPGSAQEPPEGPEVSACLPGAGYTSGCDVDQDGDIDILDMQLTAGRWSTSTSTTPSSSRPT